MSEELAVYTQINLEGFNFLMTYQKPISMSIINHLAAKPNTTATL